MSAPVALQPFLPRPPTWTRPLALLMGLVTAVTAAVWATPAAAQPTERLTVDFGHSTGPVRHGASGFLYGLNDDGVPSDSLLEPLRLRSIAQAAPFALQHPGGNALDVADAFFRTGGEYIAIYMQEVYAQWPYDDIGDDNGMADYLPKIERTVNAVAARSDRDRFVYIPFNEPDWIWYRIGAWRAQAAYERDRDRFFADWKTAYERIRALHPGARIGGPNESGYDPRFLADFLPWAKANNVLPDVMTWHELPTGQLAHYRANYQAYRDLEQRTGVGPLPIDINEWGGRRDLSVPARLLQFITMFEDTKVDAGGQAYWNPSGNLSGSASQTNRPGGGWWLLKMYGDLSGDTVKVDPPHPNAVDTMQGLAAIDRDTRQARVVVGGGGEDTDVVLNNLDRRLFGSTAHVIVRRTTWSGYDADAPPPAVLSERQVDVRDGRLVVPLRQVDEMAAYEIIVAPVGGRPTAAPLPWQQRLEAENAAIVSGTVTVRGTPENWNQPAASNARDVGSLNQPDSAVTFTVTVPRTGLYNLGILYGNQTGAVAQQVLRIDERDPTMVSYPATLDWAYRARRDVHMRLSAGTHTLTLAKSDPALGVARGEATLDRLDLTELPADGRPRTERYEAELARVGDTVRHEYHRRGQSGSGYVSVPPGAQVTFDVAVPADGYYDLRASYASRARAGAAAGAVSVDGQRVDGAVLRPGRPGGAWHQQSERLYLSAGVHRLSISASGRDELWLDALDVATAVAGSRPVRSVEAEDPTNLLTGTAVRAPSFSASGGGQVTGVGGGAANTITVPGVRSPSGGQHVLMLHYANDERGRGDAFNHNIVTRKVRISVNGGPAVTVNLRNTWSWENFWSVGVPVNLAPGDNTVALSNDEGPAPHFDRFDVAPLRVPM